MRISDWSSDVCSSDLFESRVAGVTRAEPMTVFREHRLIDRREDHSRRLPNDTIIRRRDAQWAHFTIALGDIDPPHWTRAVTAFRHALDQTEIGRASCRERVCQYVKISVVAVSLKKKKK